MLTAEEIRTLIDALATKRFEIIIDGGRALVVDGTSGSAVMKRAPGYANDERYAALQAKLSIMLEAEMRRGR